MKKLVVLGMGLCLALAFTSCKSSESAYKKAYEKAKQQELAEAQVAEEAPAAAPVVAAPVATTPAAPVAVGTVLEILVLHLDVRLVYSGSRTVTHRNVGIGCFGRAVGVRRSVAVATGGGEAQQQRHIEMELVPVPGIGFSVKLGSGHFHIIHQNHHRLTCH